MYLPTLPREAHPLIVSSLLLLRDVLRQLDGHLFPNTKQRTGIRIRKNKSERVTVDFEMNTTSEANFFFCPQGFNDNKTALRGVV